ncbi:MAG: flavodoxin family protein [Chloroflexi bacterium]|nr:flavodoxin family protein [Chloroflexota bacterium]MCL5108090.1 flavodoxin family protein [Chloroflexota bacterium]
MRVLGIVGSPRRWGNTDVLVSEVLRGAASTGAVTEKVILSSLKIHPCLACENCHQDGLCRQTDDMAGLLARMFESDVWVLGTPVYWWGPSAQMKMFIDRWYAPVHSKELRALMRKRVTLVTAFADEAPSTPQHIVGMLDDAIAYLKAEWAGQLHVTAGARGAVSHDPKAMQEAFDLGTHLAPVPAR